MTSPEDAKTLFADATADFPAITGSPTDDDVKNITEVLKNLLQSIDIPGGSDSLSGLLDDDADYRAEYGHSFDRLLQVMSALSLMGMGRRITSSLMGPGRRRGRRGLVACVGGK